MPYIAFDLRALEDAGDVARKAGLSADAIVAGLVRLWAWCWRHKTDRVRTGHVAGFFGGDAAGALELFGFLADPDKDTFRVCGAEKYLRIRAAQSAAGQAAKANLRPGTTKKPAPRQKKAEPPRVDPERSRGQAEVDFGSPLGSGSALTPSTEHRTPSSQSPSETGPAQKAPASPFHALIALMVEDARLLGHDLKWRVNADAYGKALKDMRETETDEEIRRRWRIGLRRKWPTIRTPLDLKKFWDHCATDEPGRDVTRGPLPPSSFKDYDPNDPAQNPF